MRIDRISVANIRNLESLSLNFHPHCTLIHGANGAGKTAILEAVHLLSDARTFRHNEVRPLIRDTVAEGTAHGLLCPAEGAALRVGVSKNRNGETRIRVDRHADWSAVQLAASVPMLVLAEQGDDLARGGSRARRRQMDWGLFHVEPGFYGAWKQARLALRQRNQLLRRDKLCASELAVWDAQFCQAAEQLDGFRRSYCERLAPLLEETWEALLGASLALSMRYHRGWPEARVLPEVLDEHRQRDLQQGHTGYGPQRADLRISGRLGELQRTLSRGQMKLAHWGLKIAQLRLHQEMGREPAICLVDDLPAELDRRNQGRLLEVLHHTGCQLLITALEEGLEPGAAQRAAGMAVFHVEQGRVRGEPGISGASE